MECIGGDGAHWRCQLRWRDVQSRRSRFIRLPAVEKHVKTCPNLRAIYAWAWELYVKDGENYHQVERTQDELCDVIASYEAHIRD
jgi:hypothetical protein